LHTSNNYTVSTHLQKIICLNRFEYGERANCLENFDEVLTNLSKTSVDQFRIIFPQKNKKIVDVNVLIVNVLKKHIDDIFLRHLVFGVTRKKCVCLYM